MHRLLICCTLPDAIADQAQAMFACVMRPPSQRLAAFIASAQAADAVLIAPNNRCDAALIAQLPQSCRVLGTFSAGTEHVDLDAAAARGLAVVNTPGVLSQATAEIALLLLLSASRRASEAERGLRAGQWAGWSPHGPLLGQCLAGKTLGIFGMGRIGQVLAVMARAMGMRIHYHNRNRLPPALEDDAVFHADAETFLAASQCLALCAPGGPATHHWLDAAAIARLPRGAIVVNTARGSLIDDAALAAALRSGQVAAAGLDVFAQEPLVPAEYLDLPNMVLLPHIGSATVETRAAMGALVLQGIADVLAARPASNRVV